ncbi:MAG: flagellar protein FliT [Bacillota bacterium]
MDRRETDVPVDLYRRYLQLSEQLADAGRSGDCDRVTQLLVARAELQNEISGCPDPGLGDVREIRQILAEVTRLDAGITEEMKQRRDALSREMQRAAGSAPVSLYRARSPVALDRRA